MLIFKLPVIRLFSSKETPDMVIGRYLIVKCLDKSIKKYKDMDSYRLSGRSHDMLGKKLIREHKNES